MFSESAATQHGFHIHSGCGGHALKTPAVASSASTKGEQRKRNVFFTVVSFLGNGRYRVHAMLLLCTTSIVTMFSQGGG